MDFVTPFNRDNYYIIFVLKNRYGDVACIIVIAVNVVIGQNIRV